MSLSFNLMVWLFVAFCQTTDIGKACMKVFPMSLTDADKATILDVHNKLRRQVAQGTETRGSPGPQPSASNMRQLKWDDELAQMAQTLVQQCVFGHDANRNVGNYICHIFAKRLKMSNSWKLSLVWLWTARFPVGQNLAIQFSTVQFKKSNWTSQISSWYNEVKYMDKSYVASFPLVIFHYVLDKFLTKWFKYN